jgi:hypothetical protein
MTVEANRTAAIHHRKPETVCRVESDVAVDVMLLISRRRDIAPQPQLGRH